MIVITNTENLRQCKVRFSLIVEQILAFAASTNLIREVKNNSPNFKQITWRCFELLNVLIGIERTILSLNFKQFRQTLHSDSLVVVNITCYFL